MNTDFGANKASVGSIQEGAFEGTYFRDISHNLHLLISGETSFKPPPIDYWGKFPIWLNFLKQYTYTDFFTYLVRPLRIL